MFVEYQKRGWVWYRDHRTAVAAPFRFRYHEPMKTLMRFFGASLALCFVFATIPLRVQAGLIPYDPNNIIRDDIFMNVTSMSVQDIQSFLTSQGSCLATASPSDLGSTGQTAAQIIAQAAAAANNGAGINPQVIMTTLQKEWSLITLGCSSLESLYGGFSGGPQVYLKRAAGYNVPDVLGVGSCLYSFTAQLLGNDCSSGNAGPGRYMGSPSSLRSSFDANRVGPGGSYPWPTPFTVQQYSDKAGNITVTPNTKATSALYRYTPYAYYGNFNFFNIFQTFFGNPICRTNLTVIKVPEGTESSVLYSGTRYPISSLDTLKAWGLDCVPVTYVTSAVYAGYPVGGSITRVFKEIEGPQVYIAQNGARRHIRTSLYVDQLGLSSEPFFELPAGLIAGIPETNPLGFLVQGTGQSAIYLAQASSKYYVADIPTLEAWGFPLSELVTVNPNYLTDLPTAGTLTSLVKGTGPDIYVATVRSFAYAPSVARLQDWGMQNITITNLDDSFLKSLPKLGPLSRLTRGTGTDTYYIENKKRYYVSTINAAANFERLYGSPTPMSDTAISAIPYAGKK
jgi:hypothetical protein